MLETLIIIIAGLIISRILFFKFSIVSKKIEISKQPSISVIIPARNEENNIALLLRDLENQTMPNFEVICVDDCSTDSTSEVISKFSAKLISLKEKPKGWLGKSWACHSGAKQATGELLLFLDADVRLGKNAIARLANAYYNEGCTISVQPYHKTKKRYEQFSMFFNIVQFAANGLGVPKGNHIGLYGPVILISRENYDKSGGHEQIKESIIDDIALGIELKKAGIPFKLFLGDKDIYFRMYSGSFSDLFRGWLKNIASGAIITPIIRLIMIFIWVTSCLSVTINLISWAVQANYLMVVLFSILYLFWTLELLRISPKIGSFDFLSIILFPVNLTFFFVVCIFSLLKKIFRIKTVWKGRKV